MRAAASSAASFFRVAPNFPRERLEHELVDRTAEATDDVVLVGNRRLSVDDARRHRHRIVEAHLHGAHRAEKRQQVPEAQGVIEVATEKTNPVPLLMLDELVAHDRPQLVQHTRHHRVHLVRPMIEGEPMTLEARAQTSGVRRSFHDGDPMSVTRKIVGGSEPGDTATEDDHVFGLRHFELAFWRRPSFAPPNSGTAAGSGEGCPSFS